MKTLMEFLYRFSNGILILFLIGIISMIPNYDIIHIILLLLFVCVFILLIIKIDIHTSELYKKTRKNYTRYLVLFSPLFIFILSLFVGDFDSIISLINNIIIISCAYIGLIEPIKKIISDNLNNQIIKLSEQISENSKDDFIYINNLKIFKFKNGEISDKALISEFDYKFKYLIFLKHIIKNNYK